MVLELVGATAEPVWFDFPDLPPRIYLPVRRHVSLWVDAVPWVPSRMPVRVYERRIGTRYEFVGYEYR